MGTDSLNISHGDFSIQLKFFYLRMRPKFTPTYIKLRDNLLILYSVSHLSFIVFIGNDRRKDKNNSDTKF